MSSRPIRTVIVDDEPLARELVREFLSEDEEFEIVAECGNGFDAVKAVSEHNPDVLLLDIQMPKLDGFEVLELLDQSPLVVFITAHDEHAVRAFEVHAVDYLLKPFSVERFREVMRRVRIRLDEGVGRGLPVARSALRGGPAQRILVRLEEGKIEVIPTVKLDYAEAQDDAIDLVTGGRRLRKQQTLGDLESELDPSRFVRIHRSYLLNLDRLERVEPYAKDSRVAVLRDGTKLPISRAGYARLRELL
ncbi:MAG TPA: response regulator [Thermoanaerobaculia bacterium]|nr:response regulator [Thermoanaerobaculia bacterium]